MTRGRAYYSSGCRKTRYPDELSARLVLTTVKWRRRNREGGKTEKRVYCCPRCYGWHLTSQGGPDGT